MAEDRVSEIDHDLRESKKHVFYRMSIEYCKILKTIRINVNKQEQVFNIFHPMEVKEKMRADKSVCSVTTEKDNIYLQIDKLPFELAGNEILEEKRIFFSAVMLLLEQIETLRENDELHNDYLLKEFQQLELHHKEDYINYEMPHLAVTYLIPLLKANMAAIWLPFEPQDASDEVCRRFILPWKLLLEKKTLHNVAEVMDPFHKLIWQAWIPEFSNIINQWRYKEPGPMIDIMIRWEQLLPVWIMDHILDNIIFSIIFSEVKAWKPSLDPGPIHTWIFPWFPLLGTQIEHLYAFIYQEMGKALARWEPSNPLAHSLFIPWLPVFSKEGIIKFLLKNILPRLERALKMWTIHSDPKQQEWDTWRAVMQWRNLVPVSDFSDMLGSCFFRKWFQVLATLLEQCNLNHEEIAVWYKTWTSYFPPELAENPAFEGQLTQALDIIKQSGVDLSLFTTSFPLQVLTAIQTPTAPPKILRKPNNLRKHVMNECANRLRKFRAWSRDWGEGQPFFGIGDEYAYIDRESVFVLRRNGTWELSTVEELMEVS